MKYFQFVILIMLLTFIITCESQNPAARLCRSLELEYPDKGFVTALKATKWEESLITGNGTIGALVRGNPGDDIIILSHEKLFMPQYPPTKAPNLQKHLKKIRKLTLAGKGREAAAIAIEAGKDAGIEDLIWTDPLVPACQLIIKSEENSTIIDHARIMNFETGEAISAWKTDSALYHQKTFVSRTDQLAVIQIKSPDQAKLNFSFHLEQLPLPETDDDEEFDVNELIENVNIAHSKDFLTYTTTFKKQWPGSLKGYNVTCKIIPVNGEVENTIDRLLVKEADEILILADIKLFYNTPVSPNPLDIKVQADYSRLLSSHQQVHQEMFNRFNLELGGGSREAAFSESLLASSSPGSLNTRLVEQLCQAARYELICSTGEIPPTLQGIWGGTWRPAWSGDFTLNGNVPSAIACGLNCNFQEVTEAYINYMWSMLDDFRDNARDLYGAPGIFVPSRSSSSGKTYHYLEEYPHLFWYAGDAWTAQFFYDYWQYTHDAKFLKEKAIPFMLASMVFYKHILTKDSSGRYMFLPSYSPEVGPVGHHPVVINATMDIAALKQLLRNLLTLESQGWIKDGDVVLWNKLLKGLPEYAVDSNGELKEWIWPGLENNNEHRHASHLYPLFYENDPEFENNPQLKKAAEQAIESRMKYRRAKNGAEMAFGLVQKGLAAAHINDTKHAYECVDWLCNSYWTPVLTSYHDPGEIFNADICGGLPAVVTEMLLQSSSKELSLLPALPEQWPEGKVHGALTRCGVSVDLQWKNGKPSKVSLMAKWDTEFVITYAGKEWPQKMSKGQTMDWLMQ